MGVRPSPTIFVIRWRVLWAVLASALALAGNPLDKAQVEPRYHRASAVYAELDAMAAGRPGVATAVEVGHSVEGRPIRGWRLRDPASPVCGKLLIFANIHALEWVPTEVALAFGEAFVAQPIAGVEIVMIPSLNVDGRAKVEADLEAGRNAYRRGNAHGVDLNRDFAVNRDSAAIWKSIIPRRYAVSPGTLSQPESQAIDALAAAEHFDASVSLHAFGGYFYYPWAGRWARPADLAELGRLAGVMQSAMTEHPYKPRQLSRWGFFFRGLGMEVDHLYGRYGAMSFLIETTRSGVAGPRDLGNYFRWYNPRDPRPHAAEGVAYLRALAAEVAAGHVHAVTPPSPAAPPPPSP
jgi:hypothetical protein